jgi:hypothetical protein
MADLNNMQLAQAMVANQRWADRLGWDTYVDPIEVALQITKTDLGSADFAAGVARWQTAQSLSVDGIIGPQTWTQLRTALAPPDSITGVVPDAPKVPNGWDEVVATFGDPGPYLSPDGSMTDDSKSAWERKTLARGTLPYPVSLGPNAGEKTDFYAHRLLVDVFVGVFREIDRLGLRPAIHSWDGVYNFRPIRGTTRHLSLHAFGAAIDLNASTNPLGGSGDMDPRIIDVFRHFGFFWGGDFHGRSDPMHFQYATGY